MSVVLARSANSFFEVEIATTKQSSQKLLSKFYFQQWKPYDWNVEDAKETL